MLPSLKTAPKLCNAIYLKLLLFIITDGICRCVGAATQRILRHIEDNKKAPVGAFSILVSAATPPSCIRFLVYNLRYYARTYSTATFTDCETQTFVHRDWG